MEQAANSQYYVHGRVLGSSWVKPAPRLDRPYTYWRISVIEQLYGSSLGSEITVRQPGGEIGDRGYHVAGAAEFAGGEEVFIAMHDTDENSDVKEVVGLASGKFRVEQAFDGRKIVMSGLGLPVTGGDGKPLSPAEFKALLGRISRNEITKDDRNVFVSRNATHEIEQSPESKAREESASNLRTTEVNISKNLPANDSKSNENRIQENPSYSEESSTGSSAIAWIIAAVLLLSLLIGIAVALRR